jgi:hypothetical protein
MMRDLRREAAADVRRGAGAGEHDAHFRIVDQGREEGVEPRAFVRDEVGDREPDGRLLRDLARGPLAAGHFHFRAHAPHACM